jgi:hypothetical protein
MYEMFPGDFLVIFILAVPYVLFLVFLRIFPVIQRGAAKMIFMSASCRENPD